MEKIWGLCLKDQNDGHDFCYKCVTRIFETIPEDPSIFPARCDGRRLNINNGDFLDQGLVDRYTRREAELDTSNHFYCSNPRCGILIPSDQVSDDGYVHCEIRGQHSRTQYRQGKTYHIVESECPKNTDAEMLRELATNQRWQSCKSCQLFIEKYDGCVHMA